MKGELQQMQAMLRARDDAIQQAKVREDEHVGMQAECQLQLQQAAAAQRDLGAELAGWRAAAEQAAARTSEIYEEMHRRVAAARLEGQRDGYEAAEKHGREMEAASAAEQIASGAAASVAMQRCEAAVAASVTAAAIGATHREIIEPLRRTHGIVVVASSIGQRDFEARDAKRLAADLLGDHMARLGSQLQHEMEQRSKQASVSVVAAAERADSLAKELAAAYEQLPAVRATAAAQYNELLRAHESLRRSQTELAAQLEDTEGDAAARRTELARLHAEIEALSAQNKELRLELEETEESAAAMAEDRMQMKTRLRELEGELECWVRSGSGLETLINAREQQNLQQAETMEQRMHSLREEQDANSAAQDQVSEELLRMQGLVLERDGHISELRSQLLRSEEVGSRERERYSALEKASNDFEEQFASAREALEGQLAAATAEGRRWQEQAQRTESETGKLSDEKTSLAIKSGELQQELHENAASHAIKCGEIQHQLDMSIASHARELAALRKEHGEHLAGAEDEHRSSLAAAEESHRTTQSVIREDLQENVQRAADEHRRVTVALEDLHREGQLALREELHAAALEADRLKAMLVSAERKASEEIAAAKLASEKTVDEVRAASAEEIEKAVFESAAQASASAQEAAERHSAEWSDAEAAAKQQLVRSQVQLQEAMEAISRLKTQCAGWAEESAVAKAQVSELEDQQRLQRQHTAAVYGHCVMAGFWRPRCQRRVLQAWRQRAARAGQSTILGKAARLAGARFHFSQWRDQMRAGCEQHARLRQSLARWQFTQKLGAWRRLREHAEQQRHEAMVQTRWDDREQQLTDDFQGRLGELEEVMELETAEKERLERKAEMSIKVAQVERTARERAEQDKAASLERGQAECNTIEQRFARAHSEMEEELQSVREGMSAKVQHALEQQRRELEATKKARMASEKRVAEVEAAAANAREELSMRGKGGDERMRKELQRKRIEVTKLKEQAAVDSAAIEKLQTEKSAAMKRLERVWATQQSPRQRVGITPVHASRSRGNDGVLMTDMVPSDASNSVRKPLTPHFVDPQNSWADQTNMTPGVREKLQLQVAQQKAFFVAEKQARGHAEKARDEAVQIAQQATRAIEQMVNSAASPVSPAPAAGQHTGEDSPEEAAGGAEHRNWFMDEGGRALGAGVSVSAGAGTGAGTRPGGGGAAAESEGALSVSGTSSEGNCDGVRSPAQGGRRSLQPPRAGRPRS
eukprot:SAG22_NODE_139_length_18025_cov_4.352058_2_plen_1226_part_00